MSSIGSFDFEIEEHSIMFTFTSSSFCFARYTLSRRSRGHKKYIPATLIAVVIEGTLLVISANKPSDIYPLVRLDLRPEIKEEKINPDVKKQQKQTLSGGGDTGTVTTEKKLSENLFIFYLESYSVCVYMSKFYIWAFSA